MMTAIKPKLALGLCIALAGGLAAAARAGEIPLGNYGGRPTAEITIDGKGPYAVIVDTGARGLLLDHALAAELGLNPVGADRVGAPGAEHPMEVPVYAPVSVTVGGETFEMAEVTSLDLSGLLANAGAPRGVVGLWDLKLGLLDVDLVSGKLGFAPEGVLDAGEPGVLPLHWRPDLPFPEFPISIAGEPFMAHLDTGSPGLITLPKEVEGALAFKGPPAVIGRARMIGAERDVWGGTLDGQVAVGAITLQDPQVALLEKIPGVNLGSPFVAMARVEIDLAHDLIRLAPREEP